MTFDVVVVGLGHAGCEAALAAARMGASTLAISLRLDRAAVMSCNPAIGGTAKGHLVKELDALGGQMALAADEAGTHFVTLNRSRGPAVQATRVLCDRDLYAGTMRAALEAQARLQLLEGEVSRLIVESGQLVGLELTDGLQISSRTLVLTTGTFLQGVLHRGTELEHGGRVGDAAASALSTSLRALGFSLGRFKTGTPARLLARTIDFSRCNPQPSEQAPRPFSRRSTGHFPRNGVVTCAITHTTPATHAVVRRNLGASPLFQGRIEGLGPRYCPSLEDKVHRFAHRERHTVFLEPEGRGSPLVYPAGLSTSLPAEVQVELLRTIPGLEAVEVERFGYAVEYDYAPPTQLTPTLETRRIKGLFFAGQLNGTSGYEEAAVQGLLAGINAAALVLGHEPLVLRRDEAHAGVLVDELVTRGVDEPFRMMTSRSEHRLRLREDTAAWRLSGHGHRLGLISGEHLARVREEEANVRSELERLERSGRLSALRVPGVTWEEATSLDPSRPPLSAQLQEAVLIEARYAPYVLQVENELVRQSTDADSIRVPDTFDFETIRGLSNEARQRLSNRPATFGAVRNLGLTPAMVTLVLVHLRRAVSRETRPVGNPVENPSSAGRRTISAR